MKFRRVLREFTTFPATTAIGLLWIVVYVAMSAVQVVPPVQESWLGGGISSTTAHFFGDLTSAELYRGQVWRVVTATFVHYGLLHLVVNLVSLFLLGRWVEDWYGTGRFVALYVVLGGLGNTLAGLSRPFLPTIAGRDPWLNHSGGGSTAIFGLVTLLGVGAWRSKTRFGDYAKGIILFQLVVNGALAWFLRKSLDHYGHAGGAIVGALVGLADHVLSQNPEGPGSRLAGRVGALILLCCALAQGAADLREPWPRPITPVRMVPAPPPPPPIPPLPEAQRRLRVVLELELIAQAVFQRSTLDRPFPPVTLPVQPSLGRLRSAIHHGQRPIASLPPTQILTLILPDLDAHRGDLGSGATAEPYRQMVRLAREAARRRPSTGQVRAFGLAWEAVFRRATEEAAQVAPTLNLAPKVVAPAPQPRMESRQK